MISIKKRKLIKRIAVLLINFIIAFGLTACSQVKLSSKMDSDVFIDLDGQICSTGEALMRLLQEKSLYEKSVDGDLASFWKKSVGSQHMSDYVKSSVKETLTRYTAALGMADNLAVYLSDEEQQAVQTEAALALNDIAQTHDMNLYEIDETDAVNLYTKKALYEKVCDRLSTDVLEGITENNTKVIKVSYVLIPGNKGFDEAENVRTLLKNSVDFQKTCEEAGYAPQMNMVIKRGDINAQFEDVAYALKDQEVSEVVDSKDGYYIIRCEEDYMIEESVANHNSEVATAKSNAFLEAYEDFASKHKIRYNNSFWNKLKISELQ